jgi:hypothetical protein
LVSESISTLVQRGRLASHYSGSGHPCMHAQPCLSVQLCIQGLGDAACCFGWCADTCFTYWMW